MIGDGLFEDQKRTVYIFSFVGFLKTIDFVLQY
jgi:hypothetical protein